MNKSLKLQDYHRYNWTPAELAAEILKSAGVVILLAYFFYRSVWAILPLSFIGVCFFKADARQKAARRKAELCMQFKECILSVAASLRAGYAVENAFVESRNDIRLLYGEASPIYAELEGIRRGLVINLTLEELLTDLAERSDSEDILQFAQVFAIAKRGGGNLTEVICTTAAMIGRRIDAKQEIQTMLSGRKMEQTIMKLMPFGILLYIGSTSPGYFDSLYHNLQGIAVMTVCLGIYLVAYAIGDKILQTIAQEMG